MKLFQLNLWQGRLTPRVLQLLDKERPDIACFQEVLSADGNVQFPDSLFNTLQLITKTLGHEHVFFSPLFAGTYGRTPISGGNAIISRWPFTETRTVFTHGQFDTVDSWEHHVPNTRNLQIARIRIGGEKTLSLLNHHGHWEKNQFGSETSVEKMRLVAGEVKKIPEPLILAGDLNVVAESKAMRVFGGLLEDLTATHTIRSTLSALGKVTDVACDHILVSPGVSVQEFKVLDDLVSDHTALVLDFDL